MCYIMHKEVVNKPTLVLIFDIFVITENVLLIFFTSSTSLENANYTYMCLKNLVGLPTHLLAKMQSVLNAAARLVFSARKYDHLTPVLQELHWLRAPERIMFRLAVLLYRRLHDLAPSYLAAELHRVTDVNHRRRLRSASTAALIVRPTLHSSVGDRSFSIAAARTWNSLPPSVTASQFL